MLFQYIVHIAENGHLVISNCLDNLLNPFMELFAKVDCLAKSCADR